MNQEPGIRFSDRAYSAVTWLLPVLSILTVALVQFTSGAGTPRGILVSCVYTLCFDFVCLYYLELNKFLILTNPAAVVMIILTPAVCLPAIFMGHTFVIVPVVMITLMLTSAVTDLTMGFIYAFGIYTFSAMFAEPSVGLLLKLLLIICLAAFLMRAANSRTLLINELVLTVFVALIALIDKQFVLSALLDLDILAIYMLSIVCLIGSNMVYRYIAAHYSVLEAARESFERNNTNAEASTAHNEADTPDLGTIRDEYDEKLAHQQALIDAQTHNIEQLREQNKELSDKLDETGGCSVHSVDEIILPSFEFCRRMRKDMPKLCMHCFKIARMSSEAAELIGCDRDMAYAIGVYHEAQKVLGEEYRDILNKTYHIPKYIIRNVELIKSKTNTLPVSREAGIVLLSDDIVNTLLYLRSRNNAEVSLERIVTNTFKVRKDQNFLRQAGFSNEEVQLLKLFYNDKGGNYDVTD